MLTKVKKTNISKIVATVLIKFTLNNTTITIVDNKNNTIISGSAGILGLKGSRRSTTYASQSLANLFGKKIYLLGIRYVCIKIKGLSNGINSSLKGLSLAGLKILYISNLTFLPFNGCRAPKKRRI